MAIFNRDPKFVVYDTMHWLVNQRQDATLPGYLIVGAKDAEAVTLDRLSHEALREMGIVLGAVVQAVEICLRPSHVYVCRFGHAVGHSFHFHVIPVYPWVQTVYDHFERGPESVIKYPTWSDGPSLTLFVSEEFTHGRSPCTIVGETVETAIASLRALLSGSAVKE